MKRKQRPEDRKTEHFRSQVDSWNSRNRSRITANINFHVIIHRQMVGMCTAFLAHQKLRKLITTKSRLDVFPLGILFFHLGLLLRKMSSLSMRITNSAIVNFCQGIYHPQKFTWPNSNRAHFWAFFFMQMHERMLKNTERKKESKKERSRQGGRKKRKKIDSENSR